MEYAGLRCPRCFWVLHDGAYGMNPDCYCYGKRLRKRIRLTNTEAQEKMKYIQRRERVAFKCKIGGGCDLEGRDD